MEEEIDIRKYSRLFLRRKWIFVAVFCGILLLTWIKTLITPKTFVATSKVLIKRTSTLIGESKILEEAFGIETNCQILKSRGFMERVVDYMKENGIKVSFLDVKGAPDTLLGITGITSLKDVDIIEITVRAPNANESAVLANSIAEAFKSYSVEIARAKVTEKRKFIEKQLPEIEARLRESEDIIQRFKEKEGLVSVTASGNILQEELSKLQADYSALLSDISTEEILIINMEEELKKENQHLSEEIIKIDDSSLLNLRTQLLSLGNQYSAYVLAGLPKDHPKLIELENKMQKIKQSLQEKVSNYAEKEILSVDPLFFIKELSKKILDTRAELLSLKAKKSAMEKRIEESKVLVQHFPQKEYELSRLERNYKLNENVYQRLTEHYEETKITEISEIGNVVIAEKAAVPVAPISPNPTRNMGLAIVFGIAMGVGIVLLLEYLDPSIKDVEEVKRLKIPVTGTIPITGTIPEHRENVIENPISSPAEAYKRLRLNLKFTVPYSIDGGIKSMLISSCRPKEGKSTIVSNLGVIYARADIETVIIDVDLRKPSLHKIFHISPKKGLTNFLVGEAKKENILHPTKIDKLWLIPAGHLPPNPTELIESEYMKTLLSGLRKDFGMVILDSPPLNSCTDGFLLGNLVDGVVLILEIGGTPRDLLLQTISSFRSTGTNFLGVIINKAKEKLHYRYPYYSYTPESKAQ